MKTKICSKCKLKKSLDEFFYRAYGSKDNRMSCCKECKTKLIYKWREKNPEKWLAYVRKRYFLDKESGQILNQLSRSPTKKSIYKRRTRYGITETQIQGLLVKQSNKCAICFKNFINNKFQVDHCHKTNKIRGLLCHRCNFGLGCFGDNIVNLHQAIVYLI